MPIGMILQMLRSFCDELRHKKLTILPLVCLLKQTRQHLLKTKETNKWGDFLVGKIHSIGLEGEH